MTDRRRGLLYRPPVAFLVTGAMATLVTLVVLQPRLGHTFPSMIDDWAAISRSPHAIGDALTLRNPESLRYRPGFIVWNYIQWHTFGGPDHLVVPSVWGVLRVATFVFGLVGAAFVLLVRNAIRPGDDIIRAFMAGGAALAVTTMPEPAIDLARYGPQEPLMVGLMCGGGALVAVALRRALAGTASVAQTWVLGVPGLLLWAGGIAQKETSVCALVLVPFLWMATRNWRPRLAQAAPGVRLAVFALLVLCLVSFVPMFVRVVQLSLADSHVYAAEPNSDAMGATLRQLSQMTSALGSRTGPFLLLGALALMAVLAVLRRIEWVATGLLLTGLASLAFAAQTPHGPSRYYIPLVALSVLAVVRLASAMPRVPMLLVIGAFCLAGLLQVPAAHRAVANWLSGERSQEQLLRAVTERRAAGCPVKVTGTDIELIMALPVLGPMTHQRPGGCTTGDRFLIVVTGSHGPASADGDAAVRACGKGRVLVVDNDLARIYRCEPAGS